MKPRSLRFLFDQDYAYSYDWTAPHKIATGAVTEYSPTNTILQFDEDSYTYWYDSAKHAVDYDKNAQKFRVRNYTERTSITADWPFDVSAGSGDFLPFNYSNGIVNATYHSGSTAALNPVADSSFRMNDVNYWFGMSMDLEFYLPRCILHTDAGVDLIPASKRLEAAAARLQGEHRTGAYRRKHLWC